MVRAAILLAGIPADALHWSLMAWSTPRKLGLLVGGGLIGITAIGLSTIQGEPGPLHLRYDRIKVSMTAGEVCEILFDDVRDGWLGRNQAVSATRMRPSSVWTWSEWGETPEKISISLDAKWRVAGKHYQSGFPLKVHRWLNRLLRMVHW
jgi:hypothetical protein